MSRVSVFMIGLSLLSVAGCDTSSPRFDYGVGKTEVVTGRTAQGVGGGMVMAPDIRAKAAGGGLVATGVMLEEDGLARMERAEARMAEASDATAD